MNMPEPSFSCHVDVGFADLIVRDHRVHGIRVLPGVVFFDLVHRILAARGIDIGRLELREVLFSEPVVVEDGGSRRISLSFTPEREGVWSVRGRSQARENFACVAAIVDAQGPATARRAHTSAEPLDLDAAYAYARAVGIEHLDFMKAEGSVWLDPERLVARIEPSELARRYAAEFVLHPACLDSATLVPFLAAMRGDEAKLRPFIPIHLRRFRAWAPINAAFEVVVERRSCTLQEDLFRCDIELRDPATGACLARFDGLTTKRIRSPESLERLIAQPPNERPIADEPPVASQAARDEAPVEPSGSPVELALALVRGLVEAEIDQTSTELDDDANFYELGLDSADLLSISAALGERLGVSLYPTLLFERSSIRALAEHLAEQQRDALPMLDGRAAPAAPASVGVEPRPAPLRSVSADAVAIIGLAGRYAHADDVDALWREVLAPGRDCVSEVPASRWDHSRWFDPDRKRDDRCYAKWGSFLAGVDQFDPVAFRIAPREAELMDPQERLFLEIASETLVDAGYGGQALAGRRVGVFVGVMWAQYEALGVERSATGPEVLTPMSFAASVANRVSYHFDLRGPSLALDSMCSSSLTALHLACESLRRGEAELALAGGVNLILHPSKYLFLSRSHMLASDGRCRSFGAGGDGYVPGEGVGAVLLKPLRAAERDGDSIHGVIRATAVNHGGRANGYTVPDPDAQAEVIAAALAEAGIEPRSLGYVEAHGTGTRLGDPIEVRGLDKAFGQDQGWRCAIGSIKSNLGHLEAAAGIAGLTKILLQMRHRELAPSLHARPLNPHIDFASSAFVVQQERGPWDPPDAGPRRAGLSSFGAGGSNAHAIVEEYVERARRSATPGAELIVLSARTRAQLDGGVARLRGWLEGVAGGRLEPSLASVAFTLATRDDAMGVRAATVVESLAELCEALAELDGGRGRRGAPGRERSASAP